MNCSLIVQKFQNVTDAVTAPTKSKKLPLTVRGSERPNALEAVDPIRRDQAADGDRVDPAAAVVERPVEARDHRLGAVRTEHLAVRVDQGAFPVELHEAVDVQRRRCGCDHRRSLRRETHVSSKRRRSPEPERHRATRKQSKRRSYSRHLGPPGS